MSDSITPSIAPLVSVAQPKQARSEQSLRRLLDAAELLIRERHGLDQVSIGEIAKRAKSSVGGFYARFRDKDELLLALQERFLHYLQEQIDHVEQQTRDTSLQALLSSSVSLLVSVHRSHQRLMTAFWSRAAHNERLSRAAVGFRNATIERFAQLMLCYRDAIGHPEPEVAVELAAHMALSFMEQTVAAGPVRARGRQLSDDRLKAEILNMVLSYLAAREGS